MAGICGHVEVSQAFHLSTHTDPGPNFPWSQFMAVVLGGPVGDDDVLNPEEHKALLDIAEVLKSDRTDRKTWRDTLTGLLNRIVDRLDALVAKP
jgi:N-acetyl-anhydromuramyl-L-alanine amidase AmpD